MNNRTIIKWAIVFAILAVLAVFYCRPANAAEFKPTVVNEMESTPGESKRDFLIRVATFMYGWSYSTGNESCGVIAKQGKRFSVVITTLGSQVQCDSAMIYSGWKTTGENIHSHPLSDDSGKIVLTARTKEVAQGALDGREFVIAQRQQFSEGDYLAGPGYLVDNGVLLYQRGKGTQRKIADVPNLAAQDGG